MENGCSIYLAAIINSLQLKSHFLGLGSCTHPTAFNLYKKTLLEIPHPVFGFFPLHPLCCCGVLGYEYSVYNWLNSNVIARKTHLSLFDSAHSE